MICISLNFDFFIGTFWLGMLPESSTYGLSWIWGSLRTDILLPTKRGSSHCSSGKVASNS